MHASPQNAYTPTSDQRAELQDLILNVHEKVQFGNNRGIHEYILEKVYVVLDCMFQIQHRL